MKTTIGQVLDKIDEMRLIVREIESGVSIEDSTLDKIVDYLSEYMHVLECVKVDI